MTDLDSLAAQLEELNAVQEAAQEPEESSPVKTRKKPKKEKKDEPKPEKKSRKAVIALIFGFKLTKEKVEQYTAEIAARS